MKAASSILPRRRSCCVVDLTASSILPRRRSCRFVDLAASSILPRRRACRVVDLFYRVVELAASSILPRRRACHVVKLAASSILPRRRACRWAVKAGFHLGERSSNFPVGFRPEENYLEWKPAFRGRRQIDFVPDSVYICSAMLLTPSRPLPYHRGIHTDDYINTDICTL